MLHSYEGTGRRKDMTEEFTTLVFQTLLGRSKNRKLGKKDTWLNNLELAFALLKNYGREVKFILAKVSQLMLLVVKGVGLVVRKFKLI
jgi:hypothetical protein